MPTIEIIIRPQGQSQIQTKGFIGATCRVASQFLEQTMGSISQEQLAPEFHEVDASQQTIVTDNL